MTTTDDQARITRLRATRDRLEAQLADPSTPPYSVAPLSNQLRLTDKEIERLQRKEAEQDDGLPTTPDKATFIDFLRYGARERRRVEGHFTPMVWSGRLEEIFEEWAAAGFVVPPRPERRAGVNRRQELEEWCEAVRAELTRCLDNHKAGGGTR